MSGWKDFKYTSLSGRGAIAKYRPYLEVVIRAGDKAMNVFAIIDSGAESTVINEEIAPLLGIRIKDYEEIKFGGVGSTTWSGYRVPIHILIPDMEVSYDTHVTFGPIEAEMLLGQEGFFDRFHVLFQANEMNFKVRSVSRIKKGKLG